MKFKTTYRKLTPNIVLKGHPKYDKILYLKTVLKKGEKVLTPEMQKKWSANYKTGKASGIEYDSGFVNGERFWNVYFKISNTNPFEETIKFCYDIEEMTEAEFIELQRKGAFSRL